ncbi:MAG: hypothetical protein EON92_07825 [Burkholderiales bacterium]|nr:MAG: hypothetical protein EON92_07825 [Burkholderiales bacterium]
MANRSLKGMFVRLRDEVRLGDCVHYSDSDLALTWLVLFEVSTLHVALPPALEHVLEVAFQQVISALRADKIKIDYVPQSPQVLDLPNARSPLYMQALLYWCAKLDCSPHILVDAYSRLGRSSPVSQAFLMVSNLKQEDENRRGRSTRGPDRAGTMPVFLATLPAR